MKKFEFRLERVERWRALQMQLQEEKARKAAVLLETARGEALAMANLRRTSAAQIQTGGETTALASYPGFVQKLGREIQAANNNVMRLESATNAEKRRLLEMHRGVRLLERLHENRRQEWQAEVDRENERFAGEVFLGRVQSKLRARSSGG